MYDKVLLNIIPLSDIHLKLIQCTSGKTGYAEELSQIGKNSWNFQTRRCNCDVSTRYINVSLQI